MDFDTAYEAFMSKHRRLRKGRRLKRLIEGHGYLEKLILRNIWWPAIGHFDDLHPEYEVSDFRDGTRFLDFAWLPGPIKLDVEGDGRESHGTKASKEDFSDDRNRQNHLVIDDWKVLRFSHDSVKEQPRMCQQILQQFMGRYFGSLSKTTLDLSLEERDSATRVPTSRRGSSCGCMPVASNRAANRPQVASGAEGETAS